MGTHMEGADRREELLRILKENRMPVSGSELAGRLGVSRQVIVQDIALLRAVNKNILSTTKGYILYEQALGKVNRVFLVRHTTEQIEEELKTIVRLGGRVQNVTVFHEIYGQIEAGLVVESEQDVDDFVRRVAANQSVPLKELTDGVHLHTVEADTEEILDRIEEELRRKGFLWREPDRPAEAGGRCNRP